jgi:hypothetical protein
MSAQSADNRTKEGRLTRPVQRTGTNEARPVPGTISVRAGGPHGDAKRREAARALDGARLGCGPGMAVVCWSGMDDSPERAFLAQLEERLAEGDQVEVEISLVLLAGRALDLDEDELKGARRRAVQLLAAGGDPRRDLDPDGRAVTALAEDLDSPTRRAALGAGLASLRPTVAGLTHVSARLERLEFDDALAWRWFACTLLGEVLVED